MADVELADSIDPGNPNIAIERALVLSALGRDGEAEAELDQLVDADNSDEILKLAALTERAAIRARRGQVRLAIEDLNKAIARQPALQQYLTRGRLQEGSGQLASAAAGYRDGLSKLGSRGVLLNERLIAVEICTKFMATR